MLDLRKPMAKSDRTSLGKQQWKCKKCSLAKVEAIDSKAKRVETFLKMTC